ncbi:uncharacterized protein LOC120624663 [Pararge aegeria]|uniref:uncharacterized protein LOC120624663 n=1 Tax=Pararge aegeria TaxID=116150 RepID=UPI0019D277D1|nr:uncharacterized protein LOC120624663 [Pararge aegeria]
MADATKSSAHSPGRLIAKYLQENGNGATVTDIVQHLQGQPSGTTKPAMELNKTVESILADATTLGFLERKGSKFKYWVAKEACSWARRCRRRPKRACKPRRRRRCSRRRRRRRRCRCG